MEESGSEGLEEALQRHKDDFLGNVDMTCISDNYWLGRNKPCLTYGLRYAIFGKHYERYAGADSMHDFVHDFKSFPILHMQLFNFRGICYYFIEVKCARQDLHSGTYGGTVYVFHHLCDRGSSEAMILVVRNIWYF